MEQGARETATEVLEGGMPIDDDDACVAADVAKGLVMWAWHDVAAIAAHQAELGTRYMGKVLISPVFNNAGARRGIH